MNSPSFKGPLSFVWRFVKKQCLAFLFIALVSFVWSMDATLWPYIFRLFIDGMNQHEMNRSEVWQAIQLPIIYGLVLWVTIECGFRCQGFLIAKIFPKIESDIRVAMFDHIQKHSPHYFQDRLAGSLANKMSDMTSNVSMVLQTLLTMFLPALATAIISTSFFFALQPVFSGILGLWIVLHSAVCIFSAKKCVEYEHIHAESRSTLIGKMVDSLQNHFSVNLFFRFKDELRQLGPNVAQELKTHRASRRFVEKVRIVLGAICFIVGCLSLYGAMIYFWIEGKISTGEVAQIFTTSWNVMMIMWLVGTTIPTFVQSYGVMKQAFAVMCDPQDINDVQGAKPLVVTQGDITFENVSFYYGDRQLFSNKSIHIPGGQKVGLVGYSGAGKSTFVNLILRFHSVKEGKISIDGQNIHEVTLESLRKQVALIPQDPQLFHRSIRENIAFGRIAAQDAEIIHAAKQAHAHEFISALPSEYDAVVGERGTKLSGGERQRIAIARAILAQAPILILDEATSALDSVTERYIQDALEHLMAEKTVIAVAHRLSTLVKMDRLLVFSDGKIIEDGTHAELLAKKGHYAHMWQMQAGGFIPDHDIEKVGTV